MNFFCSQCGAQAAPGTRFCANCGSSLQARPMPSFSPPIYSYPARPQRKRGCRPLSTLLLLIGVGVVVALVFWEDIYTLFGPQPIAIYKTANKEIDAIAWSPDGHHVAVATHDNEKRENPQPIAQIFATTSGKLVATYTAHTSAIDALVWSPDGKRIASGSGSISAFKEDHVVRIWDPQSGHTLVTHNNYYPYGDGDYKAIAWSPDGKRVASAGKDFSVDIWNAATGETQLNYACECGGANGVVTINWSPDGKRVASTDLADQFNIWDAITGARVFSASLKDGFSQVMTALWSPDGRYIAYGYRVKQSSDYALQVFDTATMGKRTSFATNIGSGYISNVTWLQDSQQLILLRKSTSTQLPDHHIETWKLAGNSLQRSCEHDLNPTATARYRKSRIGSVDSLAFSQDRARIAFSGGYRGGLEVWPAGCVS